MNLGYDSLSITEIIKLQRDSPFRGFKFDSVRIELLHNGERFAILPINLRSHVNRTYIKSTNYVLDSLNANVKIFIIQFIMTFKKSE